MWQERWCVNASHIWIRKLSWLCISFFFIHFNNLKNVHLLEVAFPFSFFQLQTNLIKSSNNPVAALSPALPPPNCFSPIWIKPFKSSVCQNNRFRTNLHTKRSSNSFYFSIFDYQPFYHLLIKIKIWVPSNIILHSSAKRILSLWTLGDHIVGPFWFIQHLKLNCRTIRNNPWISTKCINFANDLSFCNSKSSSQDYKTFVQCSANSL